jgi:hypothetical protein
MRTVALIISLLAMLALALWFAAQSFLVLEGPDMPVELYLAMGFGILLSIAVDCGLMALVFYSSRHGYDDAAHRPTDDRRDPV